MPFSTTENLKGEKNDKQRIDLSEYAEAIIQDDMVEFGLIMPGKESNIREGFNRFLNTVFENFYRKAEASISLRLKELEEELELTFKDICVDKATRKLILQRLLDSKAEEMMRKVNAYPKRVSASRGSQELKTKASPTFTFTLNRDNYDYLSGAESECEEDKYYTGRSGRRKYIKGVVEEYTRLPHAKRESIFFSGEIEKINIAISKKRTLIVTSSGGNTYRVYPYAVRQDTSANTNYLVGFCEKINSDEEKRVCGFKISALKSIKEGLNKSVITEDEIDFLESEIKSKGVNFLMNSSANVIVKLTKEGLINYRRIHTLRPTRSKEIMKEKDLDELNDIDNINLIKKKLATKEEGSAILAFQCTVSQAEFYFIRFGRNAEILSPHDLRERLHETYEKLANIYSE